MSTGVCPQLASYIYIYVHVAIYNVGIVYGVLRNCKMADIPMQKKNKVAAVTCERKLFSEIP